MINSISDACKNIPLKKDSDLEFASWFNGANSMHESVSSGFTDFMYRILTADLLKNIGDPSTTSCCEIGFGGGRLLLPASFIFNHAYGIDIHDNFQRVEERLKSFNRSNFSLHKSENAEKEIPNNNIKFAYSFITFQHFESWSVAEQYIDLLDKKLTPDGYSILFFGDNRFDDQNVRIETPKNYEDFPMTLYVKESFVVEELSKKFEVLDSGITTKRPWLSDSSRQFYIKFRKK